MADIPLKKLTLTVKNSIYNTFEVIKVFVILLSHLCFTSYLYIVDVMEGFLQGFT